jgi:hypothetical protein
MRANDRQIGGDHYKKAGKTGEEHWDRQYRLFGPGYFVGCSTKYIERYKDKNGKADLEKALHFIEKLIELEYPEHPVQQIADAVGGKIGWAATLPDGSGAAVMSMPLPKDHWLTKEGWNEVSPAPFLMGTDDPRRKEWAEKIREAGKYAYRCATANGKEEDIDPDALLQNLVVGMLGVWTPDGKSKLDMGLPPPPAWVDPREKIARELRDGTFRGVPPERPPDYNPYTDKETFNPEHAPLPSFPRPAGLYPNVKPSGWVNFVFEGTSVHESLFTCRICRGEVRCPAEANPGDYHSC